MRALATWSGAIAGLLLILVGGLIQAAAPLPAASGGWNLTTLPITLQVPALLLTALVCGPRSGMLAAVAYLSLGLFQLPVFQGGGGAAYLLDPGFGYLAGFIPAAWLTGKLVRQQGMDDSALIDEVYLAGLSRYPTADERTKLSKLIESTPPDQAREAVEDLFWAVFSSREFLFNH